jgi:hypothetical protein
VGHEPRLSSIETDSYSATIGNENFSTTFGIGTNGMAGLGLSSGGYEVHGGFGLNLKDGIGIDINVGFGKTQNDKSKSYDITLGVGPVLVGMYLLSQSAIALAPVGL